MKTLKESLLDNPEKSLASNPVSVMYPVPKVREFQKNVWGGQFIDWRCPELIQNYIHNLDNTYFDHCSKSDIVGIRVTIHSKYEIYTYLFTNGTVLIQLLLNLRVLRTQQIVFQMRRKCY